MANKQIDVSDSKFAISLPDLLKLLGVVAAIGMSYAMASSRLSLIEKGIRDGQESVIRLEARLSKVEADLLQHAQQSDENHHQQDLRMQSLEERLFGESRSPSLRPAPRARTPTYNTRPQPQQPETQETPTEKTRQQQYRDLNL